TWLRATGALLSSPHPPIVAAASSVVNTSLPFDLHRPHRPHRRHSAACNIFRPWLSTTEQRPCQSGPRRLRAADKRTPTAVSLHSAISQTESGRSLSVATRAGFVSARNLRRGP